MSSTDKHTTPAPLVVLPAEAQAMLEDSSPATLRRLIAEGKFPPPLVIGRARVWPREALARWIEQQWAALGVAKRDATTPTPVFVREPAEHPAGKQPRKLRCCDAAKPAPNASIDQQEGGVK